MAFREADGNSEEAVIFIASIFIPKKSCSIDKFKSLEQLYMCKPIYIAVSAISISGPEY